MTRARRIHQGERTHSQRRVGIEIPAGTTGELTGDGTGEALPPIPWDGCKACGKHLEANPRVDHGLYAVVTAPSGTEHLAEDPDADTTLCGRSIGEEWSS